MPQFRPAMPAEADITRATARLPGLDIEIVHRRPAEGDSEQISIALTAVPSFEAFGRALENANPFMFWVQGMQFAWQSWIEATRALAAPWGALASGATAVGPAAIGLKTAVDPDHVTGQSQA